MSFNGMNVAVLSLGSNAERSGDMVDCAMGWLLSIDPDLRESAIYYTEPLNGNGPQYANAVVEIRVASNLDELVELTKEFESACGRNSSAREKKEVPVDIDVVMFNGEIVRPRDFDCEYFKKGYRQLYP